MVPADKKSFRRIVVAAALVEALEGLKLEYQGRCGKALQEPEKARKTLTARGARLSRKIDAKLRNKVRAAPRTRSQVSRGSHARDVPAAAYQQDLMRWIFLPRTLFL